MKKIIILFLIVNSNSGNCQDLINPYIDFNTKTKIQAFQYPPINYSALNTNGFLYSPLDRHFIHSGQYSGEYMIFLNEHPWYKEPVFQQLAKTFSIEVVSFPFTIPCWDINNGGCSVGPCYGCGYPCYGTISERILLMPDDLYDPNTFKWGNLNRIFEGGFSNGNNPPWCSDPGRLVSSRFAKCGNYPILSA